MMGTIEIVLLLRQETLKEASKIKEYYRMQMKTKRRNFSEQNFFKNLNIYIAKKVTRITPQEKMIGVTKQETCCTQEADT